MTFDDPIDRQRNEANDSQQNLNGLDSVTRKDGNIYTGTRDLPHSQAKNKSNEHLLTKPMLPKEYSDYLASKIDSLEQNNKTLDGKIESIKWMIGLLTSVFLVLGTIGITILNNGLKEIRTGQANNFSEIRQESARMAEENRQTIFSINQSLSTRIDDTRAP